MIALILAAGMGTRLRPLTDEIPKALLEINNMTLLERMIKNCIDADIKKFFIIVGYYKDKIFNLAPKLAEKYDIEISIFVNEKFSETNTSVSTYIGSKKLNEDFIIINGDNVVDPQIIKKIATCPNTGMIIDNYKTLNEESFKLIINNKTLNENKTIANGEIEAIGKELNILSSYGEFIGVSKVIKEDINKFNEILSELINQNPQNYYDFVYKDLSKISKIDFVLTNGLKWTEIDDHNDWKNAQILVNKLEN